MNLAWKKPFNPEWISYYMQLNQSLNSFKATCPSFLENEERVYILQKIEAIQNLIQIQITRIQQMNQ